MHRLAPVIYALYFLLTLSSCSSGGPTGPTVDLTDQVIVAFGNSITVGLGDTISPRGYPFRLERLLQGMFPSVIVLNRGVSGEKSREGVRRIGRILSHDQPHYVLILEGTNDIVGGGTIWANGIVRNIAGMVAAVKASGATPLVASLLPTTASSGFKNECIEFTNPMLRDLAEREEVPFVDLHTAFLDHDDYTLLLSDDGLHPNANGYTLIAETWHNSLLGSL